jgi:hypothetical protein
MKKKEEALLLVFWEVVVCVLVRVWLCCVNG